MHLGGDDGSGEDTAADRNEAGEWAFLVCSNQSAYCSRLPCSRISPSYAELHKSARASSTLMCRIAEDDLASIVQADARIAVGFILAFPARGEKQHSRIPM